MERKKEQEGPWAMACSPEWNSHCRYADVMQHFSNPVIAINERIIIWAVLVLKKNVSFIIISFFIYGHDSQWSMTIWQTLDLTWNLVASGQVVSEKRSHLKI